MTDADPFADAIAELGDALDLDDDQRVLVAQALDKLLELAVKRALAEVKLREPTTRASSYGSFAFALRRQAKKKAESESDSS